MLNWFYILFICYILQKTVNTEVKTKLTNLVRVAIERAEALKGIKVVEDDSVMKSLAKLPSVPETNFPDTDDKPVESEQPVNTTPTSTPTASSGKYIWKKE